MRPNRPHDAAAGALTDLSSSRTNGRGATKSDSLSGRRGSRSLLRDLNMSLLIELVRQRGPISRAELARQSQISPATITAVVAHLLGRGIVSEVALAPSRGGRPPILLQLNPEAGFAVGVKLRGDGLTTVVCDLDARIVATDELSETLAGDPTAAVAAVEHATRRVLRQARVARSKVLGVGIGLSGIIDPHQGICRFSHLLDWSDVSLGEPLSKRLRLPVWVDNDVKTLAIAEKWTGDGIAAHNFVTLSVGRGVGLGIVIDRSLYRGAAGGAGELGHIIVEVDGPLCECGRAGCLEALVGEQALRRRIGERLGRSISHDELVLLAGSGDLVTHDVLEEAGRELGIAVANAMTLLNPELLIIGGEGTELGPAFLDPVVSAVHDLTFANLGREIEVKIQKWGDEAWAVGAATLVLRETFNIPDADEERQAIWHRLGV